MTETSIASIPVQITRLEMTAPPKTSLAIPINIQAAVMRAPKIPLPFYRYLYRQVGARWQWVDRMRMSDEELTNVLHDERNDVSVLYVNGAPAGFFEHFRVDEDTIELSHFGLIEHALGLGIGKWFLLQALYALWLSNPQKIVVTTNNLDHPRALQLYQMFGFSPVSTAQGTVTPLTDDELLEIIKRG
ncbi:GNAT family N-acetyltransferase [Rhizobium sp. VS19-DR104.2]|uniref:GNAT family N-acetyltransferase n=1 Tax=unclassified Rhizobium TaxID=2613769 RepID=UPI001C5AAD79|nr:MULTISPECIES: GNAT family N-acetyltransferase [unclassified Rhizobium]MBZ5761430.1 GNAT family N-acetyltransferase [Rhizobium sp. VS19-DR96]MBZ5767378.1 GNAT family N-acetyltransferase [Rhizobium sp. VS19-DR129.2]MBZ5775173.1 GNAT family N-acetyltransferase [Rhizobium sp. VS19-DRK62.2]MBZ5785862.1 GNAT family N-acetyltransferase [Rhizobium sp. VS19-DR121]MBZ5803288.1 GNAT family N-acetyltransferase [Rhizobium sp. VS19-DR181]